MLNHFKLALQVSAIVFAAGFGHAQADSGFSVPPEGYARFEKAFEPVPANEKVVSKNFSNEACDTGKVWVAYGRDRNENGSLDANEVESYNCEEIVIKTRTVPISRFSVECQFRGGVRTEMAADLNADRKLDPKTEVWTLDVHCNPESKFLHYLP